MEAAVLLAEGVLDLKRLRERCEVKCGRGMVGLHVSVGRRGTCPAVPWFLSPAIETRPPIVRIGGPKCRKSAGKAVPSGTAFKVRHGSNGSSAHAQAGIACLSGLKGDEQLAK